MYREICLYINICIYACMYVCMYVCACMYVPTDVCEYVSVCVCDHFVRQAPLERSPPTDRRKRTRTQIQLSPVALFQGLGSSRGRV